MEHRPMKVPIAQCDRPECLPYFKQSFSGCANTPAGKYNAAVSLMEAEKYSEAIAAFQNLGDYKDSLLKIEETKSRLLSMQ